MSHPDPAPRGTPGRSTRSTSWLVAGAAAIIIILVIIFWNSFSGPDEATIADDTPTVEEQESTGSDAGTPLEEAGEAIADGPESPLEGADGDADNAVADEAARENKIIQENAAESPQDDSPVEDAQRTTEEVQSEEQPSGQ